MQESCHSIRFGVGKRKEVDVMGVTVRQKIAQHFKGIGPDTLKGRFEAIEDGINNLGLDILSNMY